MRNIHIVSSRAGRGSLAIYFKKHEINDDIVICELDFNHGKLLKDFSCGEIQKRNRFLNTFFYTQRIDINNYFKFNFSEYDKIVVWHGDNVDEILLFSMVCAQFDRDIYHIDIAKIVALDKAIIQMKYPYSIGTLNEIQIQMLYDRVEIVPIDIKVCNADMWRDKWSRSEGTLRILDDNRNVVEVEEDYYDGLILSHCSDSFTKLARVIGHCIVAYNQFISDQFLLNRVVSLMENGRIVVCNNPQFADQIAASEVSVDKNVYVNGLNVTQMRFLMVKLP